VFLRVNNQDPINFTNYTIGQFPLRQITTSDIHISDIQTNGLRGIGTDAGAYRYYLDAIPITDDYLGEGKVFAFVLNFSDGTGGQDSVNVIILNNELVFNQPGPYYIQPGQSVLINLNNFMSDVETSDSEIVTSYGDEWPFTVTQTSHNIYKVTAPATFEGEHNILFTGDDTDGSIVTRSVEFYVAQNQTNQPPRASFTYNPQNPLVNDTVIFNSTSYDPDGQIVRYTWKINGATVSTQENFQYVFTLEGDYEVSLTVTDNDGARDTTTQDVHVSAITRNQPPVADFTFTAPVIVNQPVTFKSTSYDPDGKIVGYEWKVDGQVAGTQSKLTYTFTTVGLHTVDLKVTDNDGATAHKTKQVYVNQNIIGKLPVAILSVPSSTIQNKSTVLDASGSYDPDGQIVQYQWKIVKDGRVIDGFITTTPIVTYAFKQLYTNYVQLSVVDNDGNTASASARVDVGKQKGGVLTDYGNDDGLFVEYFDVFGTDRDTIGLDEPYTVSVTVHNGKDKTIRNVRAYFEVPEIGYKIYSEAHDLDAGETRQFLIQDYLPFLPGDILAGDYIGIVGAKANGIDRNKYYPLIIK